MVSRKVKSETVSREKRENNEIYSHRDQTRPQNKNSVLCVTCHKEVKAVRCSNKESLKFLKASIRSLGELWPAGKFRTTARVWIPPPLIEDETTLSLVKGQNEEVHSFEPFFEALSSVACRGRLLICVEFNANSPCSPQAELTKYY